MKAKSLNIKQIRYFAAVVELGSLSSAAKDQFVTVQAVSKAIADLERELGRSLFVRESRGVHPTPFGKSFYQKAAPVLKDFDDLEAFARDYRENAQANTLRLALCSPAFSGNERARASIAAFTKRGLGIDATVALEGGSAGMAGLRAGDYDALITIGAFANPDIDCVSVGTVAPGVVMAKSHPLANDDSVRLVDLEPYPIGVSPDFDSFNESIVTVYRKRRPDLNFVPLVSKQLDRHFTVDQGVCLMVHIPVLGEMMQGTVARPIAPADAIAVPICLISLKNRKAPTYLAFEHWLANELVVLGGGMLGASR